MQVHPIKRVLRPFYVPIANLHHRLFKAPRRYHYLYDYIHEIKAKHILEVGVYKGQKALRMITAAKDAGVEVPVYYGFDLFENLDADMHKAEFSKWPVSEAEAKELLSATGAEIHLYKGNTFETLPKVTPMLPKMDLIFIDGGHSNETIANDWDYTKTLMGDNTVVIFDDYWHGRTDGGSKKLIDSLDRNMYEIEILPEIDCFRGTPSGDIDISLGKVTKRVLGV